MKIAYEHHPVSPERKAELRAAGFKIIDARFAPDEQRAELTTPERTKRGRPRRSAAEHGEETQAL